MGKNLSINGNYYIHTFILRKLFFITDKACIKCCPVIKFFSSFKETLSENMSNSMIFIPTEELTQNGHFINIHKNI